MNYDYIVPNGDSDYPEYFVCAECAQEVCTHYTRGLQWVVTSQPRHNDVITPSLLQKQMDAESRVSTFERLNKDLNRQLLEVQENLENESRDKSTLLAKMRDLQASHNQAQEALEEEQELRESIQNKLNQSLQQVTQ